jgi:uncharacterized protein involved in exopolysaccharide biosynthesis
MSDTNEQQVSKGEAASNKSGREDEISILDLLLTLVDNRSLILRTVLVVTVVGLAYAVLASEQYTTSAKVIRETEQETPGLSNMGGISALRGLGINLGRSSGGLTPAAYSNVLSSREVRLAVVQDTFAFPDAESPMTFVEYVNRPPGFFGLVVKYTLGLPGVVKRIMVGPDSLHASANEGATAPLTEAESRAIDAIAERVNASVDDETGLMTITVTAEDPILASDITESFLRHLTTRIRSLRTTKVREQLEFVESRFTEAEQELTEAEDRLAQFLERNQNPTTASLRFKEDRLRRQVSFKEQLYSDFQSQLTQTRLDLQRQQPVITVVENPVPPRKRSGPRPVLIGVLSILFGLFLGVGAAFLRALFSSLDRNPEEREKLREIHGSLSSNA